MQVGRPGGSRRKCQVRRIKRISLVVFALQQLNPMCVGVSSIRPAASRFSGARKQSIVAEIVAAAECTAACTDRLNVQLSKYDLSPSSRSIMMTYRPSRSRAHHSGQLRRDDGDNEGCGRRRNRVTVGAERAAESLRITTRNLKNQATSNSCTTADLLLRKTACLARPGAVCQQGPP